MPTTAVTAQADAILNQCACFIEALPDAAFRQTSEVLGGGTIGKHLRHTLDHYRALIEGRGSVIDYDRREREVPVERDRAAALEAVESLRARITALDPAALAGPVRIRVMLSSDGSTAELDSTLARELAFASHHAIHHNAMIQAIAAEFGVACGEGFGVAPSTLEHQSSVSRSSVSRAATGGRGRARG